MATIKDVAKRAGVSVGTVSNYINGNCPISSSMSVKIKEAIAQLQYVPNTSAKSLKSKKHREIGVLLPNLNDPYYAQILQGVENALKGSGYFLNISFSHDEPALEQESLHSMLSKQVCGLIVVSCQPQAWKFYYENFSAKGRPIVMIDRLIQGLDANFIACDNCTCIRSITGNLLHDGISDVMLFTGPKQFTCEAECIKGFTAAFALHGKNVKSTQIREVALSKENAFAQTLHLLREYIPRAILTTSGLVATGVTEALTFLGISQEQTMVISLGEEHWNRNTQSSASVCTNRPAIRLGNTAVSLLLSQLSFPLQDAEHIILQDNYQAQEHSLVQLKRKDDPVKHPCNPLRLLLLDAPAVRNFQTLLQNFNTQYNVQTEVVFRPHNTILQEIQDNRDAYDLVMFDIPWLASLVNADALLDITDFLPKLNTSRYLPGCLDRFCNCGKKTYALPFLCASQVLYYRKDLFENTQIQEEFQQLYGIRLNPPLTMTEFNGIADFFTNKTDAVPYGISVAAAYPECFAPEVYFRLNSFGSKIFDENNCVTFDNPQTLQAYINLLRSVKVAKGNVMESTDHTAIDDFLRGETGMLISYPILFPNGIDLRDINIPLGYTQVPGRSPLLGGWNMGITAHCRNVQAAVDFLRWMNSDPISNYFTIIGGQTAISSIYTNDELTSLYPWLPLYRKTYSHAQMPPMPNMRNKVIPPQHMDEIICNWAYQAIQRKVDVQTAISATQADLEQFLSTYSL